MCKEYRKTAWLDEFTAPIAECDVDVISTSFITYYVISDIDIISNIVQLGLSLSVDTWQLFLRKLSHNRVFWFLLSLWMSSARV